MSKYEVTELDRTAIRTLAVRFAAEVYDASWQWPEEDDPTRPVIDTRIEAKPMTDREIGERAELLCHRAGRNQQVIDGNNYWHVYPNRDWHLEHWMMFRAAAVKHYRQQFAAPAAAER